MAEKDVVAVSGCSWHRHKPVEMRFAHAHVGETINRIEFGFLTLDQPSIVVPPDHQPIKDHQAVRRTSGVERAADMVAKAQCGVDVVLGNISQDSIKCCRVTVHV